MTMSAWKLDSLHLERSGSVPADIPSIPTETIAFAQVCDARARKGLMSDEALLEEARTARLPLGAGELPSREFLAALPAGCEVEYEVARSDLSAASPLERSASRTMPPTSASRKSRAEMLTETDTSSGQLRHSAAADASTQRLMTERVPHQNRRKHQPERASVRFLRFRNALVNTQ